MTKLSSFGLRRLFALGCLAGVCSIGEGCKPRQVDVEKASYSEAGNNLAPNAPDGLQQNPGQPTSERPSNP